MSCSFFNSFTYNFDNLPEGDYEITLYFTESFWSVSGERLFDVFIEGALVLDDYDIFAASGGIDAARTESFLANVSDGQLNIDFSGVNRVALVSAIKVVSL